MRNNADQSEKQESQLVQSIPRIIKLRLLFMTMIIMLMLIKKKRKRAEKAMCVHQVALMDNSGLQEEMIILSFPAKNKSQLLVGKQRRDVVPQKITLSRRK